MRTDRILLRGGFAASVLLAAVAFLVGLGIVSSLASLLAAILTTRVVIYLYFEHFLAYRAFGDFRSGKVKHECIACGASCHLRVNLGRDDMKRILEYAKTNGMQETVIEGRGSNYWLKRRSDGACIFLKYESGLPRCSIYTLRPTACRLYPLIPSGTRLKVDPLCPGLSTTQGHTFNEHLATQDIGTYVRKVLGRI